MNITFGDLHAHSMNSDGNKTPEERIIQIKELDLNNQYPWALTDHDCYSPNFVLPARELGINAIWATEISAHSRELDCSLHVTCYSRDMSQKIKERIDTVLIGKTAKVREQIKKLQGHGFDISEGEFFKWIRSKRYREIAVSNAHISQFLLDGEKRPATIILLDTLTSGTVHGHGGFIRECLQDGGTYSHIGTVTVPPYEPEISDLITIAKAEGIILSVAHPNFSFSKIYKKYKVNGDPIARAQHFHDRILPILLDLGMRNYEINAKATPEQVAYLVDLVKRTGGMNTFGSDNHGSDREDNKHGIFGVQNKMLTPEIARSITKKLLEFV